MGLGVERNGKVPGRWFGGDELALGASFWPGLSIVPGGVIEEQLG